LVAEGGHRAALIDENRRCLARCKTVLVTDALPLLAIEAQQAIDAGRPPLPRRSKSNPHQAPSLTPAARP
jgi:hypothetical protein